MSENKRIRGKRAERVVRKMAYLVGLKNWQETHDGDISRFPIRKFTTQYHLSLTKDLLPDLRGVEITLENAEELFPRRPQPSELGVNKPSGAPAPLTAREEHETSRVVEQPASEPSALFKSETFEYDGCPVSFRAGDEVLVNATEMAKPFGDSKRPKNWLALNSTQEFLRVLSEGRNLPSDKHLVTVTYGNNGCTWFHEDVALEFARWLSPKFAIWCNDRIKELVRHGVTTTPGFSATLANVFLTDPAKAASLLLETCRGLEKERSARLRAEEQVRQVRAAVAEKQAENDTLRPKAQAYDIFLESDESVSIPQFCGILRSHGYADLQPRDLWRYLREKGYVHKKGNRHIPYPAYSGERRLFKTRWGSPFYNENADRTITPFVVEITPLGANMIARYLLSDIREGIFSNFN